MKILYVGELSYGATSEMRLQHLKRLGHELRPVDVGGVPKANLAMRNLSRISWRLGWPLDLLGINRELLAGATHFKPDIVWVDKGVHIRRRTLLALKRRLPEIRLVHYNPDDPFGHAGKRGWRTFIAAIPAYDTLFVPRPENVAEYKARGARKVIHNVPTRGFDPEIHRPYGAENELKSEFSADVGFLGSFESERAESLRRLAQSGISVRMISDWPEEHWHPNFLRAPRNVRGAEYAKAVGSTKIGLGFLRKINRDQHSSRSIEIPACGTFLLAERTPEHLMLFEEGKEAEFFSSDDELVDKAQFYLARDGARESIARAGRERCLRSGYDYTSRMRLFLEQSLG